MNIKMICPKLPRTMLALAVLLAATGIGLPVREAAATTPPPCETTECPSAGPKAWTALTKAVVAALAVLEEDVYLNMLYFKDALTRLGNQHSNTRQNTLKSLTSVNDKDMSNRLTYDVGRARAAAAVQVSTPSRTACSADARRSAVLQASALSRAAVGAAETVNTNILTNEPSSAGGRGQLAFTNERFQNRMSRYCDNTTVSAPGGITCTATIGANRDTQPYASIFQQNVFATANDYTAAKDVVLNLMGDAVKDPVRGPALTRQEGQAASLRLYSEQAQMNLASSIMLASVERRRELGAVGSGSELSKRAEALSAGNVTPASLQMATTGAGQTSSQNLDAVSALIGESNRAIFQLRDYMEQWAAIKAVSLAIDVKQNSSGGASVSSRPIGN